MDKKNVNNFIVRMRDSVMQACVHTYNKLAKEIKKLENKKGTEKQKEKNHRKADRFREEILIMKKLNNNEISKYALLSTDLSDMMRKASLSLEERAKVRIAAHRSVALQVDTFRTKYPEWELKLPPLLVQLGMQYRNKKLKKGQNSSVIAKLSVRESVDVEELIKPCGDSDEGIESKCNVNKGLTANKKNKNINVERKILINDGERKKKSNSIAEVCKFADMLEFDKNSKSAAEDKLSPLEKKEANSTSGVVDPFFLMGDDTGESDNDINPNREEKDKQRCYGRNRDQFFTENRDNKLGGANIRGMAKASNFGRTFGSGRQLSNSDQRLPTMNRKQRRMMERTRAEGKGDSVPAHATSSFLKSCESSVKGKVGYHEEQPDFNSSYTTEKQEKLHPSWEAKRKQKAQQILPFQGKKIKFDDNDD